MPLHTLDALAVGQVWPPSCESKRTAGYARYQKLMSNEHEDVFADVIKLIRKQKRGDLTFVPIAYPSRLVKAFGDMVLGEPPRFAARSLSGTEADDALAQEQVETYVEEMGLVDEVYGALVDLQVCGDALLKVGTKRIASKADGSEELYPFIRANTPGVWYPVVSRDDCKDITAHILAWTWDCKVGNATVTNLKAEVHESGFITTYEGTVKAGKIDSLSEVGSVATTIDDSLVIALHNLRQTHETFGRSDLADLAPILQEMEVRLFLIASILDKHSDPKMHGPRSMVEVDPVTGEATVGVTDFVVTDKDMLAPGYVTWEGQLTAAYSEYKLLEDMALFVMEASRAMFGAIDGTVTSGSALKRLLISPMMKAGRLRSRLNTALVRALKLASQLHHEADPSAVVFGHVDIQWQDGVPNDDAEQATIHATLVTAGLESKLDAIRALFNVEGDELDARIARLAEEKAALPTAAPRVTLGSLTEA